MAHKHNMDTFLGYVRDWDYFVDKRTWDTPGLKRVYGHRFHCHLRPATRPNPTELYRELVRTKQLKNAVTCLFDSGRVGAAELLLSCGPL